MKRLLIPTLVALVTSSLAGPASSDFDDGAGSGEPAGKLVNGRQAQELRSRAVRLGTSSHVPNDTTYVGYNPAYAGSNYWSVGVGHRRPRGAFGPGKGDVAPVPADDTGYWDWDHPVHGDSLQGWWPARDIFRQFFITNQNDKLRPWHAVDFGNSVSYVINQGPAYQRTFGVTSAWHVDPGVNGKTPDPGHSDVNPNPPRWTPLAGSMSAWCGLRAHGDVTAMDAVTGNPYNVDALLQVPVVTPAVPVGPGWTSYKLPGYVGQWDQMLYRDIDIGDTTVALGSANVSVSFRYRTRMSTGKNTSATSATGWFDKDPLAVVAGNFISASDALAGAPIDSFMVYVGCPVADTAGAQWTGSDGATHTVFEPVRRWFGELIRANQANGHYELFTTYGDRPPIAAPADSNGFVAQTAIRNVTYGQLRAAWGNRIRLVFRIKTNRANETPSSDEKGSISGAYSSGYLGAAQVDEVGIDLGGGTVPLGDFESEGDIDNSPGASALDFWKTSSKPPAISFHVHALSDLTYEDLCGPPGSSNRICDMVGNVISMGYHDLDDASSGPFGTAEQDAYQEMFSPTINLAFDPGSPAARNNMGLDAGTAAPTQAYGIAYNIYTGYFNAFVQGQFWETFFQSYPAVQSDGTRMWGEARTGRLPNFDPEKQCFDLTVRDFDGRVRTSNANGLPDSIRVGLRKLSQCYRFGITTNCGSTAGGYYDNVSLVIIDGPTPPLAVEPWEFWNDTFPANETAGLPGTAAFDTTAALIKTGRNTSPLTGDFTRYDVPGDTTVVTASGDSTEVQLKFRIRPGPGNYVVPGDPCSGLRRVPADTTRINTGDDSFWTEYILNPGKEKDGFPTAGDCEGGGPLRHDQRWSELAWCNARCDTADQNLLPIQSRGIGGPFPGEYASMYHEDDPHLAALGLARHKCFLVDTLLANNSSSITCTTVPAWVTAGGLPYKTGYNGNPMTVEGTKILPDGLLTPGSHVEYFYVKKDLATGVTAMCPDTNLVYPQPDEESLDAHRWQQFSVLPDAWKFSSYGGLGKACMLYVDWADRLGEEPVWVSVADSIGATAATQRGVHNGWSAPGAADLNDPAYFMNRNAQPGTTWDMYGVKAAEALNTMSGTIGARLAYRGLGTYLTDKWAKNAPTVEMMSAYYRILMILTGDLSTNEITGPFDDRSADDTEFIRQFTLGATAEAHRGLWCMGSGYVEDLDANGNSTVEDILGASLRDGWYIQFSGNARACIDLIPTAVITTNGDIYGFRNSCGSFADVLTPTGDAQAASYYDPVGANPLLAPYVASVFHDAETPSAPDRYYQSMVDGWALSNLRSRMCDGSAGRRAYMWNAFTHVFGKICAVAGTGPQTTEVPNNGDGRTFVDLAGIGNNPLRQGSAVIHLTLAQADRVTVKIYDVSGRRVRTLADGQLFKAGRVDPALTWDGLDDGGRQVARGAYFVSVRYQKSRFEANRKMIVLR
jgi:hypothetical protein